MVLTLTDAAIREVKRLQQAQNVSTAALRVGVKGGGCSGVSYQLGFDTQKSEADEEVEVDGLKVWIDRKSVLYLHGMTLDYKSGLMESGFTFINPNAKSSCGCGSSFSV